MNILHTSVSSVKSGPAAVVCEKLMEPSIVTVAPDAASIVMVSEREENKPNERYEITVHRPGKQAENAYRRSAR